MMPLELRAVRLPMGIVLRDLKAYQQLIHVFTTEPCVQSVDFTYRAPLYKGTPAIREHLTPGQPAQEKFDVYFENGVLDEKTRVGLATEFRRDYARRFPGSEASDLFFASGDIMHVGFQLKNPFALENPDLAMHTIRSHPYDEAVMERLVDQRTIDLEHLSGEIRLFLDHVHNPRRRTDPAVQKVMTGSRTEDPVIVELYSSGAVPGLFVHTLEPAIDEVDGALVYLEA